MKTYKRGISLIVLVITVIVLAILATTVIVSISNTNIITKANDAVTEYNLKTYEDQLTIAYASWLIDNSGSTLTDVSELEEHGFDSDNLPDGVRVTIENGKPQIITVSVWDGTTVATSFSGGTGTSADPYLISTAAELAYLAQIENNNTATNGASYKLTTNIDLDNKSWTPINAGVIYFNGNGYTIYNLNVSVPNGYAAFFSEAGEWDNDNSWAESASISNLTIEGGQVSGKFAACFSFGYYCSISNCHNVGVTVIGTSHAYGIASNQDYNTISGCTNSGSVTGGVACGISAADGIGSYVKNCTNYGNVTATASQASGVAFGQSLSDYTSNCYNYGNIHGVTSASGINSSALDNGEDHNNDCYNYGTVTVEEGGTIYTFDEATN